MKRSVRDSRGEERKNCEAEVTSKSSPRIFRISRKHKIARYLPSLMKRREIECVSAARSTSLKFHECFELSSRWIAGLPQVISKFSTSPTLPYPRQRHPLSHFSLLSQKFRISILNFYSNFLVSASKRSKLHSFTSYNSIKNNHPFNEGKFSQVETSPNPPNNTINAVKNWLFVTNASCCCFAFSLGTK